MEVSLPLEGCDPSSLSLCGKHGATSILERDRAHERSEKI